MRWSLLRTAVPTLLAIGVVLSASPVAARDDTNQQLASIARDTWQFFDADTDPSTHLPMDNIGFNGAPSIMAALDNALNGGAMRRHLAQDPVIQAARPYLAMEQFSLED